VTVRKRRRRVSFAVSVVAVALAAGMFSLSRDLNQRDSHRLLTSEATDAKTSVTSLIAQIESTMSSAGSVAAATDG